VKTVFVDQASDETGGAQESLALLLAHLPPSIDPTVVLFGDGSYARRIRELGLNVHVLGAPTAIAGATRERISLGAARAAGSSVLQLTSLLARLKPAVVHTNSLKAHVVGGTAARLVGIPTVTHLRDVLDGRARTLVKSISAVSSRERIAISSLVAENFGLTATTVVENPLDLSAYEGLVSRTRAREALSLPPAARIVILIGRINRWKGHDRFLRAAAALPREAGAHFVIAGSARFRDADFLPELQQLARSPELSGRVSFIDWLEDPRELFAAADLNVNCSTREPFGRTVIEAAAAGVPSVVFDDSGVAEFMKPDGVGTIVPAGDELRLRDAIASYVTMENTDLDAARAKAKTWARRFEAKTHASRVAEILTRAARR